MGNEFSRGQSYAELLRVAWPLIVNMSSFTVMTFCDRMFLSWHGAAAIQAVVPAGSLAFTLSCGFMALAGYAGTFVSHFWGARDREGCSRATAQGVWLALFSWPVLLAMIPLGRRLLRGSLLDAEVAAAGCSYFTIVMLGSLGVPLGSAMAGFWTGRGVTWVTMLVSLFCDALNIVLDYAWIFGRWGFPAMGIRGAALATALAGLLNPALLLTLYLSPRTDRAFGTRRAFRLEPALFGRIVRFGWPAGLHLALDVASFTVFILLTARLGKAALAASNIALSINHVAFMPLLGLGTAVSILVGQYRGRGETREAERVAWRALQLGLAYMLVVGASFVLFPKAYFCLFARHRSPGSPPDALPLAELLPLGRKLLVVLAIWGVFDATGIVLSHALKGAGDTRFVMMYSTALAWGFLVAGQTVLIRVLRVGIVVSWAWTALYIALLALGDLWRYLSGRWKTIDVLGREAPMPPARIGPETLVGAE